MVDVVDPEEFVLRTVHISRNWHNPMIEITVTNDGIALEIALDDFCQALVSELPSPLTLLTRDRITIAILAAVKPTVEKIKHATAYV